MASSESDLILLKRYTEDGDVNAFGEIVRRYTGAVFATCLRILHDPGRAEDAAQETFYRLMTRPQRVTASLGGWLHRAATRLAVDARRSEIARRRREMGYEPPESPPTSTWDEVSPKLDEALAALPDEQRELLVRHFLRGEPQAELADEAGTSAATLSRRMKAAVDALRDQLDRRGLGLTPMLLVTLVGTHAIVTPPATLKAGLGKMTMLCAAQHGLSVGWGTVLASATRAAPRALVRAPWAAAAAAFSVLATVGILLFVQHLPLDSAGPDRFDEPVAQVSRAVPPLHAPLINIRHPNG